MMKPELAAALRNHNWRRTILDGFKLAEQQVRRDRRIKMPNVAWALLCEAAEVSRISYQAPPRSGFPGRSAMPESPDEVTQWQLMSAYLRGEISSLPDEPQKMPRPEAHVIDRAELILDLWHQTALITKGNKRALKRAVYEKALGVKPRKIIQRYDLHYKQLNAAVLEASEDMSQQVEKYNKKMIG